MDRDYSFKSGPISSFTLIKVFLFSFVQQIENKGSKPIGNFNGSKHEKGSLHIHPSHKLMVYKILRILKMSNLAYNMLSRPNFDIKSFR